jgi:predicted metal-dependent RNase
MKKRTLIASVGAGALTLVVASAGLTQQGAPDPTITACDSQCQWQRRCVLTPPLTADHVEAVRRATVAHVQASKRNVSDFESHIEANCPKRNLRYFGKALSR